MAKIELLCSFLKTNLCVIHIVFPFSYYQFTNLNIYYFISVNISERLEKAALYDPAICPNQCGRRYKGKSRKSNLKVHLKYECGVPRQFRCEYCHRTFVHKAHLKGHLGLVHGIIQ